MNFFFEEQNGIIYISDNKISGWNARQREIKKGNYYEAARSINGIVLRGKLPPLKTFLIVSIQGKLRSYSSSQGRSQCKLFR